ncbi:MAG: SAM-dependent methyltransferase [Bdellovibrionota bacterium]
MFLFTICQTGAEKALKDEIAREHRDLRFSFSRPGFVTFKRADGREFPDKAELRSVFARVYGHSLGRVNEEEVLEKARELARTKGAGKLRLHVYERDRHVPGDEPPGFVLDASAREIEARLRAGGGELFSPGREARDGELVVDLVIGERAEWWAGGQCRESRSRSPWPGARPPIELPPGAPSRAYLKLEEALQWTRAPLRAGDTALELGSAPGGACYALLERGLKVIGVDPAAMDPGILRNPRFQHLRVKMSELTREDLPAAIDWLVVDLNAPPRVSIPEVERMAEWFGASLQGMILTVKLNQWKFASFIPGILEDVKKLGMARIKAAQLSLHRQEILIYGLTRKGQLRAGGNKEKDDG